MLSRGVTGFHALALSRMVSADTWRPDRYCTRSRPEFQASASTPTAKQWLPRVPGTGEYTPRRWCGELNATVIETELHSKAFCSSLLSYKRHC